MNTYKNLYTKIYSLKNLILAWRKARKGKTRKEYVIEFEKDLIKNLLDLQKELQEQTYKPKPLITFILRDPKTRKISKSDFRDRIVHHAIVNILEPIFDKTFIYDSCANRKGKGNLFALRRFELFKRKVTNNLKTEAFCLKADIKHYFQEVDNEILIKIIKKKIKDEKVIWLVKQILSNKSIAERERRGRYLSFSTCEEFLFSKKKEFKGMPLGNLTSQFFANVYLNELDYFIKHNLKAKHYIRYVDDFVILHKSKQKLLEWKEVINDFLKKELKLELHQDKSKIISLSRGIDFIGFRNFYYFRLLRKRNIKNMENKIKKYEKGLINDAEIQEIFQGWQAYAKWANSYKLIKRMNKDIALTFS